MVWLPASLILLTFAAAVAAVRWYIVHPRQPFKAALPPLSDADRACAVNLERHVRAVASKPHNMAHPKNLEAAACYIETTLISLGLTPIAHPYSVDGQMVRNIEIMIEPTNPSGISATFVVGAHYDAPDNCPGANDNGTGVAALLELAKHLANHRPANHRLRLVFFVNEEHPYGQTVDMGSYRHAKMLKANGEAVIGMWALETLGHFPDRPGTQRFPFPFGLLFPDRGNFVAFVGMPRARRLAHQSVAVFRATTRFPAIGGVAPAFIEGVDLSDHWAYDAFGYPALMVTDTAPFRNPFYHQIFDTPDTVDYTSLARITGGLERTIKVMVPAA